MKKFRLLRADEIECRVNTVKQNGFSLLLYKTARTDADLLDETVGPENWENDFKLVDEVLYGGIGIICGDREVWKWDAGTESNTEAEKGRASDALKRAGFKWGIGRELYSAPFIWIKSNDTQKDKYKTYEVGSIEYDANERICALTITCDGNVVYRKGGTQRGNPSPKMGDTPPQNGEGKPTLCEGCGFVIVPYPSSKDGHMVTINEHINISTRMTNGRVFCPECLKQMREAKRNAS